MAKSKTYSFHTVDDPADPNSPTFTNLLGINNEGLIAGFYGSGNAGDPNQGFLLTPSGTFIPEEFPGSAQTQLTGLNDKGIVVGYFYPTNNGTTVDNQFGFYKKGNTFVEVDNPKTPGLFGNPAASNSLAGVQPLIENQLIGVNDHNIAVGFYNDATGTSHGYTYNINTGTFSANIDDPFANTTGPGGTVAAAINDKGNIAGFYTDNGGAINGFLDINGVFTTVDAPGASETELLGLNDHGIAVGFDVVNGVTNGIIYDSKTGTFTTLDDPNATGNLTEFNGINDKGDIVGFYLDSNKNTHGLLATPSGEDAGGDALLRQNMASFVTTSDGLSGTQVTDATLTSDQNTFLTQPQHG